MPDSDAWLLLRRPGALPELARDRGLQVDDPREQLLAEVHSLALGATLHQDQADLVLRARLSSPGLARAAAQRLDGAELPPGLTPLVRTLWQRRSLRRDGDTVELQSWLSLDELPPAPPVQP